MLCLLTQYCWIGDPKGVELSKFLIVAVYHLWSSFTTERKLLEWAHVALKTCRTHQWCLCLCLSCPLWVTQITVANKKSIVHIKCTLLIYRNEKAFIFREYFHLTFDPKLRKINTVIKIERILCSESKVSEVASRPGRKMNSLPIYH